MLDFSSGSEEDECGFQKNAVDTKRGGNTATESMSLLQHGFCKLLERVNGKPKIIEEDSCPSIDESSEEEADDQQGKMNWNQNQTVCPKFQRKTSNISSSSDSEDKQKGRKDNISVEPSDESVKRWTKERRTENGKEEEGEKKSFNNRHSELSRTVQKSYQAEAYSDESEDLDMEIVTKRKENTSGCDEGNGSRKRVDRDKTRQRVSVKDRKCTKISEYSDIKMFTSSEEEHTPSKKAKHATCVGTQTKRFQKSSQSLKCQTSPTSKAGTIDSVLGQVNSFNYSCLETECYHQ